MRNIRENLGLKIIAVCIALVIWVIVQTQRVPSEVRRMVMAETVPGGAAPADLIVSIHPDPVPVEIVGPKSEVEHVDDASVKAVVDLATAKPGGMQLRISGYHLPAGVTGVVTNPVRQFVSADIEEKRGRRLRVVPSFTDAAPFGKRFSAPRLVPPWADVFGRERDIERVDRLVVYIDTQGGAVRDDLPIKALDRAGVIVEGVQVQPSATHVEMNLVEAPATRTLIISVAHRGRPSAAYEITDISADPAQVTVVGPSSELLAMTNVSTAEIDLSGLKADAVRDVSLRLPPGITVRGGADSVHVTIRVRELPRGGA